MIDYKLAKTEHELETIHQLNVDDMGIEHYVQKGEYLWDAYSKAHYRIKVAAMVEQSLDYLQSSNCTEKDKQLMAVKAICDLLCSLGYEGIAGRFQDCLIKG